MSAKCPKSPPFGAPAGRVPGSAGSAQAWAREVGRPRISAAAAMVVLRPMQTSVVIDGLRWPSWSAIWRALMPASSRRVATVLRKVCKVTQSNPMRSKRRRSSAVVLERLRTLPSGEGKRTSSVLMAECLPIPLGRRPSHDE